MGGILLKRLTFGMIGALSITLLIGCTSNSNETKASNKEASTTVKEKEIVYDREFKELVNTYHKIHLNSFITTQMRYTIYVNNIK